MKRYLVLAYGVVCYALFLGVFSYMAGFLLEFLVPKGINGGQDTAPGTTSPFALWINLGVIALFGFTHSLMAREWFKKGLTRLISASAERSTYVLQSSVFLAFAMWQWQPMDAVLWSVSGPSALVFYASFGLGAGLVLLSTFLIDHFELFGLRQVWTNYAKAEMPKPVFRTPSLYRFVRHPMQLGVIILVFSTPHMTVGHLLFASAMTAYIFVGLYFEERSLLREFGADYAAYKQNVPMLFPRLTRAPLPSPRAS